jgi:hypothetical protein
MEENLPHIAEDADAPDNQAAEQHELHRVPRSQVCTRTGFSIMPRM